jgi:hypothetical protein
MDTVIRTEGSFSKTCGATEALVDLDLEVLVRRRCA